MNKENQREGVFKLCALSSRALLFETVSAKGLGNPQRLMRTTCDKQSYLERNPKNCQDSTIEAQWCQRAGDRVGESTACLTRDNALNHLGQYDKVVKFHTKSLNMYRELGNRAGEGGALANLGAVFDHLVQHNKTIEVHTKSLDISRELGDRAGEGMVSGTLGTVFCSLDQHDKTVEFHTKCLNIYRELGNRTGEDMT